MAAERAAERAAETEAAAGEAWRWWRLTVEPAPAAATATARGRREVTRVRVIG
jgi:hypothetical protein